MGCPDTDARLYAELNEYEYDKMIERDKFATQAMVLLPHATSIWDKDGKTSNAQAAAWCYDLAEAMLTERDKRIAQIRDKQDKA